MIVCYLVIQYVFIVFTTLYINIIISTFVLLYINYMFRPLRVAIFRFSTNFFEAISISSLMGGGARSHFTNCGWYGLLSGVQGDPLGLGLLLFYYVAFFP